MDLFYRVALSGNQKDCMPEGSAYLEATASATANAKCRGLLLRRAVMLRGFGRDDVFWDCGRREDE